MAAYNEYASRVVAERRRNPGDDLISILVNAEIDGERLSDEDVIGETLLILIGGDETTRHVIAGGIEQLLRHREHWDALRGDRSGHPPGRRGDAALGVAGEEHEPHADPRLRARRASS